MLLNVHNLDKYDDICQDAGLYVEEGYDLGLNRDELYPIHYPHQVFRVSLYNSPYLDLYFRFVVRHLVPLGGPVR